VNKFSDNNFWNRLGTRRRFARLFAKRNFFDAKLTLFYQPVKRTVARSEIASAWAWKSMDQLGTHIEPVDFSIAIRFTA